MRRLLLLSGLSFFCLGIIHCVDSSPSGTASDDDASTDQDATTGGDAATGSDGSTQKDGAPSDGATTDAGPPPNDSCVGHTDCPVDIEASSLQLWLRGNIGATCSTGRITTWLDQSGKANNATAAIADDASAALAPQCGIDTINTHSVPTFTAPAEPDGGNLTQYIDETLDVNMGFVAFSNYTLFVVHRRNADARMGLIGQDLSPSPTGRATDRCLSFGTPPQLALSFEYEPIDDGGQDLRLSQYCTSYESFLDDYKASTAILDEVVFSQATGHSVYTNGVVLAVGDGGGADIVPVIDGGNQGVIGRSFDRYLTDSRYQGNIAEIIGYNVALSDTERGQIEGYLKRQWGLTF